MSITEKTLTTLEFDKIRLMLSDSCPTRGAAARALSLTPADHIDFVRRRLSATTDAKRLRDAKGMPSFGSVTDVSDICERALKGAVLTPRELMDVAVLLRSSRSLLDYIRTNRLFATSIDEVFERLIPNRPVEDRISRSIISEDMISDEASPSLADVRRKIRAANVKVRETLARYTGGSYSKFLQENIVTQRNGRFVIPVKAEHRNDIKGLIHDTSSSGATIFIEPMAVVEANNELAMLESREAHEIEKVLADLSAAVAGISPSLNLNYRNVTELAFYFGCAELSARMDACEPIMTEKRHCTLLKARHPLIDKKSVVPITLSIGDGYDTLIITGPNTGGKTVTLKTLGLFAIMAQAGLHVPCNGGSELCIFEKILVDLGDEQSIEQSLSTFSSHMVNIVEVIKERNGRSLVLFDELGAGTDPIEGAALAISIIEDVRSAGAICIATTHYTELKTYALDTDGVCNASCEFDVETLRPTYKLIIGTPGKSNAFAISAKLGLPESIVNRAGELVGTENKKLESVLGELEQLRINTEKQLAEAEKQRREYEAYRQTAEADIAKRLADSEKALEQARAKAQNMVDSAKLSSDFIMEQLDKLQKQRESERLGEELARARKEIREHLRVNSDNFDPVVHRRVENYKLPRPLKKGDEVYVVNLDKTGVLTEDPDRSGKVGIQIGLIKTKVKCDDLQLIEDDPKAKKKSEKKSGAVKVTVNRDFRGEVDLRGKTGDEAWSIVDKYFDDAAISGFHSVRLIHGKGTGALKNALWAYLKRDSRVAAFRIGQFGEGDGGVTVVELK